MSLNLFIPTSFISVLSVFVLLGWFASWLYRLSKASKELKSVPPSIEALTACVPQLRQQQTWRDKLKIAGDVPPDNLSTFFNGVIQAHVPAPKVPSLAEHLKLHLRTIFLAGCDESALETSELLSSTIQALTRSAQSLPWELLVIFLVGVLGALIGLEHTLNPTGLANSFGPLTNVRNSFAPAIWGVMLCAIAAALYLRFHSRIQIPTIFALRQATLTVWIPKLYPTVAQRAAQWAIQTLRNAAKVTDASAVIEENAGRFSKSISEARHTAEVFSEGMQHFAKGVDASDQAIVRAQNTLGVQIEQFANSLKRWSAFEDEIRSFYRSADAHQTQLIEERKNLEYMLTAYRDLVTKATGVLERSATDVATSARQLPNAFDVAASRVDQTASSFDRSVTGLISSLAQQLGAQTSELNSSHLLALAEFERRLTQSLSSQEHHLQILTAPILALEERFKALSEPFDRAAHHLEEIATNLWKLNQNTTRHLEELSASTKAESAKAGRG